MYVRSRPSLYSKAKNESLRLSGENYLLAFIVRGDAVAGSRYAAGQVLLAGLADRLEKLTSVFA